MSETTAVRRRDGRRRWTRWLAVGVVLPLLAASVVIWSVADREDELDQIPVAVVNDDKILSDPQPMAAGRALTASLTDPTTSGPDLDWTLTDSADATSGLADGSYYAVLTIPSDFSSAIVSSGTDKPVQGQLQLTSNAAASSTVPYLSNRIASAAAASLANQTTQGYLKNVYAGFNQLASSNQQAASSAAQLADGTGQLAAGATSLDQGAGSLSDAVEELAAGSTELSTASGSLATGAGESARGARGVASGAEDLDEGAGALARSAGAVDEASGDLAEASGAVARGASRLATADQRVAARAKTLAGDLRALVRDCRAEGGSVRFCRRVALARDRSAVVAAGTALGARAVRGLSRATAGTARGAAALDRADARLARAARQLDAAGGRLSRGAGEASAGATSVAAGAQQVAAASGRLASGAAQASEAAGELADGSASLDSSAAKVDSGAESLSSGLAEAAAKSPTYSTAQQDALATAVSQPVVLNETVEHTSHGNGWLVAAILGAVLWLAALVAALGVDRDAIRRFASAPVSSRRLASSLALPVVGLAAAQAVAVMVAMLVFHPSIDALVPLALLCVLASVTFALVAVALRLAFGGAGIAVFVLFLLLQVAALANVVPLETAPGPLQALNGLMPLTVFTNGANQLVAGGEVASIAGVVTVLAVWALGAFAVCVALVKRRRLLPLAPRPAAAG
ncbi:YhgE/Pip family protein [Mumia sp. DW29H23]|uniref:YhgE/Pip domain-containing protein n=1 Tax=Mumia sp. DW29H23 TaxID=3421241 RepID=UPI003D69E747